MNNEINHNLPAISDEDRRDARSNTIARHGMGKITKEERDYWLGETASQPSTEQDLIDGLLNMTATPESSKRSIEMLAAWRAEQPGCGNHSMNSIAAEGCGICKAAREQDDEIAGPMPIDVNVSSEEICAFL